MSLKIYDAYIFDKEYSILELSKKLEQLKQEIKPAAINQICELAIMKFLYYYNFQILHGKEKIINLLDNKAWISNSIFAIYILRVHSRLPNTAYF